MLSHVAFVMPGTARAGWLEEGQEDPGSLAQMGDLCSLNYHHDLYGFCCLYGLQDGCRSHWSTMFDEELPSGIRAALGHALPMAEGRQQLKGLGYWFD